MIVNSNDDVEIFNNQISNNKTANVIVSSLFLTGYADDERADTFDPYPEGIYIYGNTFEGGGEDPDTPELALARVALFGMEGVLPDVIWDGYVDPAKMVDGVLPDALRVCVDNGTAEILNVDAPNGFAQPGLMGEAARCSLEKLPAITLN